MLRNACELWLALLAIILISMLYLGVVVNTGSIPAASEFFGHSLGVIGFTLMLTTELFYSLRKRSRSAKWGRTSAWLQLHIFTGLVGPYLVLLHTSWKFNGLAGVVTLLTLVIVASGFVGRYIFTAVPRSADGVLIEATELEHQISSTEEELQALVGSSDATSIAYAKRLSAMSDTALQGQGISLVFGRVIAELGFRIDAWKNERKMKAVSRPQAKQLDSLFRQRRALNRQIRSITTARHLLSIWHAVHIPLGVALFSSAIVHIFAAIYYATLIH